MLIGYPFHGHVFSKGNEDKPNPSGLAFYDKIINKLLDNSIEPIVTICHFDLPLYLVEEFGGWGDRQVVDYYLNYCEVLFQHFKGRIKYWITFNEINMILHLPFLAAGLYVSDKSYPLEYIYQAAHHQLIASAKATKLSHEISKENNIGCMLAAGKVYSYSANPEDVWLALEKIGKTISLQMFKSGESILLMHKSFSKGMTSIC